MKEIAGIFDKSANKEYIVPNKSKFYIIFKLGLYYTVSVWLLVLHQYNLPKIFKIISN